MVRTACCAVAANRRTPGARRVGCPEHSPLEYRCPSEGRSFVVGMQRKQTPEEVVMHSMLMSTLAEQNVRERSRGCENGLRRSLASRHEARAPRAAGGRSVRLALRLLVPGARREALS